MQTFREKHLSKLETVLCTIAKERNVDDPKLQAQVIRNKLVRQIDYHRSGTARNLHYGRFVESWKRENLRPDAWLCYLVRRTSLIQKIGQRRGSKSISNRASAIEEAKTVKRTQLTPVERRAFDILKGARRKSDKHPIERQAIQLARAVEDEWFSRRQKGRPKGKWRRKPDAEARSFDALKPPLTLTDLVSIARGVIEDFAGRKIALRDVTFEALLHIVCAYSKVITRETPERNLDLEGCATGPK